MNNRFEKYLLVVVIIFCSTLFAAAQKNDSTNYKKNAISLEGLGNGWVGSINYERNLGNNKHGFMTLRVGGAFNIDHDGSFFPLLLNQVYDNRPLA